MMLSVGSADLWVAVPEAAAARGTWFYSAAPGGR